MQISLGKILFFLLFSSTLHAYTFTSHIDNTHPLFGEKCILTLHFSYKDVEEYEIEEPHFENVAILPLDEKEYKDKNGTYQAIVRYTLRAQKVGTIILPPLKTHIEMIEAQYQKRYNKSSYLKKFDIYSQPITLDVQALPQGVEVIGDYQLYAHIDTNTTTQGHPIHLTVSIQGEGNLQNFDFFKLTIPQTLIYEKIQSPYEKSFDILSESNFTIPPIILEYYNKNRHKVTLESTPLFQIAVKNPSSPKKESFKSIWGFIFAGIALLLVLYFLTKQFYHDKQKTIKKQLKQCKDKEALLKKLMPYLQQNRQLKRLIYALEESEEADFKKLKKEILRYCK